MTSPIQGRATVRVEADTSQFTAQVLRAVQSAVRAAQQEISSGLVLTVDTQEVFSGLGEVTAAVDGLTQSPADVVIGADTTGLDQEVSQASGSFQGLVDAASAAASGIRTVLSGALDGLAAAAQAVGSTISTALQAGAVAATALGTATVGAGLAFNSLSQQVTGALTAVLGTRDAATQLIGEVIELNQTAAFSRQAFLDATRQLVGFGVEADQVTEALDAIQQATVAIGGGEEEFERITEALARVESEGELTAGTLGILRRLGLNVIDVIADATGESVESVQALMDEGQIGLQDITDALNTRFSGAVEGYANTWEGARGIVLAAIRNIGSALVEAFISLDEGGAAVQGLNQISEGLSHIQSVVLPAILPQVEQLAGLFLTAATAVGDFLGSIPEDAFASLGSALEGLGPLIGAIGAGLATAFAGSLPVIGQFVAGLNPIVVAIATLVAATPELRSVFVDVFGTIVDAVSPLLPILAEVGRTLLGAIVPVFATLAGVLGELVASLAPVISSILTGLMPLLTPLSALLVQVADVLGDVLVSVVDAAGPVLAELVGSLAQILAAVLPLVTALLPLLPILGDLAGLFVALLAPITPLQEIFGDLLNVIIPPLAAVIEVLATVISTVLGGALEGISGLFERLGSFLAGNSDVVTERVLPAFTTLTDFLGETVVPVLRAVAEVFGERILPVLQTVAAFITEQWLPLLVEVGQAIQEGLTDRLQAAWEFIQENFLPVLQDLAAVLQERIGEAVAAVSELWETRLQPAFERLAEIWDEQLQPAIQQLVELLNAGLRAAFEALVELWNDRLQPVLQQMAGIFVERVLPVLQEMWQLIDGPVLATLAIFAGILGSAVFGAILAVVGQLIFVVELFNRVVGVVASVTGWLADLASTLAGPVRNGFNLARTGVDLIANALRTLVGPIQVVIDALSRLIDIAGRALSAVQSVPGIGSIGGIGGFFGFGATGAIIDRPTAMIMGEGHRREVLIPLEQGPARAWDLAVRSGLVDLLTSAMGRGVWREQPMPEIVSALSRPVDLGRRGQAGLTPGGDDDLVAEVRALRAELRNARPINMPVTQAPGEDGEALAKRVVSRMTLAGVT